MSGEEPPAEAESGLPGKQGEFTIPFPWAARGALTAAIGALVGFAASGASAPLIGGRAPDWIATASGALAATVLSIRKVHVWHISTFVDGTIVGLAAAPILMILALIHAAVLREQQPFLPGVLEQMLPALVFGVVGTLVTIPCGWFAGFAYHLALVAAKRLRSDENDSD